MARNAVDLTREDPDFVTSLERGLKVLSVFDRENPQLALGDVARRAGLSPATARRFLLTFKTLGYIGQNGKLFVLRPKVLEIAHAYLHSMNVDEALQPYLREFVQRTGDCASISILDGTEIVCMATASMRRLVRLSFEVGSRIPAYPTSSGRVLLAHLSPAQLGGYFETEQFRKITEFTEANPAELKKIIKEAELRGYAAVQDELEVGLVSVAVPICGPAGNVIAAMDCTSVAGRLDQDEMVRTRLDLLRELAGQASMALRRFPSLAHSVDRESSDQSAQLETVTVD